MLIPKELESRSSPEARESAGDESVSGDSSSLVELQPIVHSRATKR